MTLKLCGLLSKSYLKFIMLRIICKKLSYLFLGQDPYRFMQHPAANIFYLRDFLKSGKRLDAPEECPNGV